MHINVQINLGLGEFAGDLSGNAEQLAENILSAIGGSPEKDIVNVVVHDSGSTGSVPTPPVETSEPGIL